MPMLSDQLKALGVRVGVKNLPPLRPKSQPAFPIEQVIAGDFWQTPHGDVFVVETRYKADFKWGAVPLKPGAPLDLIAAYAHDPRLAALPLEQFAFLDTETSGLAGGTGTYTFLVGIGRFEGPDFRLAQFFLTDPGNEPAQLAAIEQFLSPCQAVVSFNGKAFDLPLLHTRYILNGWPPPLVGVAHIDLLHLARRLWRARLPSRALGDLEAKILGAARSQRDVPGWMVPELYLDYLRSSDARPLLSVFYHNEIDVVSLAALLHYMAEILANPLSGVVEYGLDLIAIGRLYADLGNLPVAAEIIRRGLQVGGLSDEAYQQARQDLSFIYKKAGEMQSAVELWQQAANDGQPYAHVELAKFHEHQQRNFEIALQWTQAAIALVAASGFPEYERAGWLAALEHRRARLLHTQTGDNATQIVTR